MNADNPQPEETATSRFHKRLLIAVTCLLVIVPLVLGALSIMGYF